MIRGPARLGVWQHQLEPGRLCDEYIALLSGSTNSSATAVSIKTGKDLLGTYLTGPWGGRSTSGWRTLAASRAAAGRESGWPPRTTSGIPTATGGVIAADLVTITPPDAADQVTYNAARCATRWVTPDPA